MLENLILSLTVVTPLFFTIALGYGVKQSKLIKEATFIEFNKFTFNVLFPILIFIGIYNSDINTFLNAKLVIGTALITLALFIYGQVISRVVGKDPNNQVVVSHSMFRTNFLIIGFPILAALYGNEGAVYGFLLVALSNPIFNPLSVLNFELFNKKKIKLRNILINLLTSPLNIATVLGFLFLIFNIPLPAIISSTLSSLANIAPTFALIILGGTLRLKTISQVGFEFIFTILNRLVIIPLVLLAVLIALNYNAIETMALVLFFGTPVAVISYSFTVEYNANKELASALIVFSTILSAFSLVMIVTLIQSLV
jgi:malate permease and related proteins